jgi:two-component system OmpR family sensor kinase
MWRKHWLEIAWGVFAAANVLVILAIGQFETVPFHFVWVSLTILYGLRVWRARTTAVVLAAVMCSTGAALTWTVIHRQARIDELTEVPLMAAMFLAMVWHADRRRRADEDAKAATERERLMFERQRAFVRDASHELRTPITIARGHSELIRQSVHDDKRSARDVDVVLDELGRLSRLSDRLLTLAAADHPAFLSREDLPVESLLGETLTRWMPTARRRWSSVVEATGTVAADRGRLEAALDALIENAVNATSEDGRIRMSAHTDGSTLVLKIADDGLGIAADDLPRVFEPFSRRERDRARGSGGTGLGLAIVKAIVDAHGGSVAVESSPTGGTTFSIRLPDYRAAIVPGSAGEAVADPLPLHIS